MMIATRDIRDELSNRLHHVRQVKETLAEMEAVLEGQLSSLERQEQLEDAVKSSGDLQALVEMLTGTVGPLVDGHRTNVELYREIVAEHGEPMHLSNIVDTALQRGLRLRGTQEPSVQVRNALNGSKRFVNMGSNYWWLADRSVPESNSAENGNMSGTNSGHEQADDADYMAFTDILV